MGRWMRPEYQATLKGCDTTKLSVGDNIYIYIYIYIYQSLEYIEKHDRFLPPPKKNPLRPCAYIVNFTTK